MTDVARLTAADLQFDEGARLVVEGEPSNWSIGNRYTNLIAQATSTLTIEQLDGLVEADLGLRSRIGISTMRVFTPSLIGGLWRIRRTAFLDH